MAGMVERGQESGATNVYQRLGGSQVRERWMKERMASDGGWISDGDRGARLTG
jgi:hypothetical protein